MKNCTVALCGCGTVGTGVAHMLLEDGALVERLGEGIRLKYIADVRLDEVRSAVDPPEDVTLTEDLDQVLDDSQVQVVVELIGGTTTARELVAKALRAGKDVVTANKALLAAHGDELYRLARQNGRCIAFEGSVAGGIPVVGAVREGLVGDRIESFYGILNGTCNYVLTRMLQADMAYEDALAEAQSLGYAEADPTLDVEGHDSAHKLAVLARLAFGRNVDLDDIPCEGISGVDLYDLKTTHAMGYTLKLLAVGQRQGDRVELRVQPALLRQGHPMAAVSGVYNAVCVHGSQVGEVVLTGKGAGREATASAVVADVARVALGTYGMQFATMSPFGPVPDVRLVPHGEMRMRYYFRLDCQDRPGILGDVAGILGERAISIASVHQREVAEEAGAHVPVVFMTHEARESDMANALEAINSLDGIRGDRTRLLRVEDI
jgi:homoserine dehydrogenase